MKQAFVFVNSKLGCARLARSLEREGLKTTALHGDKSQDERLKALDAFKKGEVDLLVCTDVAARGLDIKDVPAVFNFDIPFNAEDYVHRIGRTGRAGASGLAVSFVSAKDARLVADIEKLIKTKIELEARGVRRGPARHPQAGPHQRRPAPVRADARNAASARGDRARAPFRPRATTPARRRRRRTPSLTSLTKRRPAEAAPAWEADGQAGQPRMSANIKPKRKVAALFKSRPTASVELSQALLAPGVCAATHFTWISSCARAWPRRTALKQPPQTQPVSSASTSGRFSQPSVDQWPKATVTSAVWRPGTSNHGR